MGFPHDLCVLGRFVVFGIRQMTRLGMKRGCLVRDPDRRDVPTRANRPHVIQRHGTELWSNTLRIVVSARS